MYKGAQKGALGPHRPKPYLGHSKASTSINIIVYIYIMQNVSVQNSKVKVNIKKEINLMKHNFKIKVKFFLK